MSDDPYAPKLPRAVQEQVERANALAREAGIANAPAAPEGEGEAQPVTTEVNAETPAPSVEGAGETQTFETSPETVQPSPAPEPDWQQRYNTLQGKYNTEMSELRGQMRALQDMMMQQQTKPAPSADGANVGANMSARPYRATQPPAAREIPSTDVDAYGQELIDGVQRWAEARMAPFLQDIDRRIMMVEGNAQQLAQVSAAQRVESGLDQAVANWREVNRSDEFILWLRQMDPFSGQPRQQLINDAYGAGDVARCIAFFRAFLQEQTAVSPPQPGIRLSQTGGGAMPAAAAGPTPLEMLAVPGRGPVAASPASGASNGKRTWSNAEIAQFYRDRQRGLWAGRDAEADAIERDLFAAPLEGRVRQ